MAHQKCLTHGEYTYLKFLTTTIFFIVLPLKFNFDKL